MRKLIYMLFFISIVTSTYSQRNNINEMDKNMKNTKEIATAYYNALISSDFDKVMELSSPDMVFEDPTSTGVIPAQLNGRKAVIQASNNEYDNLP